LAFLLSAALSSLDSVDAAEEVDERDEVLEVLEVVDLGEGPVEGDITGEVEAEWCC